MVSVSTQVFKIQKQLITRVVQAFIVLVAICHLINCITFHLLLGKYGLRW